MINYNDTNYRYKGTWITYDELLTKVFEFLETNPFQDHEFIASKFGSKPSAIESAIKDGIVKITKKYKDENKADVTFSYLCKTYGVKMSYIEDLIDEGRILINNASSSSELEEIFEQEKEAKRLQRLDSLRQLSDSFKTNIPSQLDDSTSARFHTYGSNRRK